MTRLRRCFTLRSLAIAGASGSGPSVTGPTTARTAPRWAVRAAHAAAVCPLPSTLWRLPLMFGLSMVPFFGGRRIAPAVVIVPATLGGVAATFFGVTLALTFPGNIDGVNGWVVLMIACYLPLVAWGPLVLAVTFAYYQRRRDARREW